MSARRKPVLRKLGAAGAWVEAWPVTRRIEGAAFPSVALAIFLPSSLKKTAMPSCSSSHTSTAGQQAACASG